MEAVRRPKPVPADDFILKWFRERDKELYFYQDSFFNFSENVIEEMGKINKELDDIKRILIKINEEE